MYLWHLCHNDTNWNHFKKQNARLFSAFYTIILVQITEKIGALWKHWTPDSYFSQIRLKYTWNHRKSALHLNETNKKHKPIVQWECKSNTLLWHFIFTVCYHSVVVLLKVYLVFINIAGVLGILNIPAYILV